MKTTPPGKLISRIGRRGVEIPEQQRRLGRRVVGILLPQGVRIDPQALNVTVLGSSEELPFSSYARSAQNIFRPSTRSKFAIVFIATAYTIC